MAKEGSGEGSGGGWKRKGSWVHEGEMKELVTVGELMRDKDESGTKEEGGY